MVMVLGSKVMADPTRAWPIARQRFPSALHFKGVSRGTSTTSTASRADLRRMPRASLRRDAELHGAPGSVATPPASRRCGDRTARSFALPRSRRFHTSPTRCAGRASSPGTPPELMLVRRSHRLDAAVATSLGTQPRSPSGSCRAAPRSTGTGSDMAARKKPTVISAPGGTPPLAVNQSEQAWLSKPVPDSCGSLLV